MKFLRELFKKKADSKREELKRIYIEGLENGQDLTLEYVEALRKLEKGCTKKK